MKRQYFVYILTNRNNTVLYTGMTNDLDRRVSEHKTKVNQGFTSRYNVSKLVFYEVFEKVEDAKLRERQIKAGSRRRKIDLIAGMNPGWEDLYNHPLA